MVQLPQSVGEWHNILDLPSPPTYQQSILISWTMGLHSPSSTWQVYVCPHCRTEPTCSHGSRVFFTRLFSGRSFQWRGGLFYRDVPPQLRCTNHSSPGQSLAADSGQRENTEGRFQERVEQRLHFRAKLGNTYRTIKQSDREANVSREMMLWDSHWRCTLLRPGSNICL